MRKTPASKIAFGGIFAALALVIMNLGSLIPVATYVCPMLCMLILALVTGMCGNRIGWAWYGAVAILSVLMAPDKEAAAVFVFLGYYPIIKPRFDRLRHPADTEAGAVQYGDPPYVLAAAEAAGYGQNRSGI